jgi:hypothetical protein
MLFSKPIDELDLKPETKKILTDTLIFKNLPFVKRVIFMSTPHRGAAMTQWPLIKLAVKTITLPLRLANKLVDISKIIGDKSTLGIDKDITKIQGVDGLDPNNKIMQHMVNVPIKVKYNSIMGNNEKAGEIGGTDGIVDYKSAHLDGSESELVIKSGHNVQQKTAGIKEVRRILLQNLDELKSKK